jgi:hypothetical protein
MKYSSGRLWRSMKVNSLSTRVIHSFIHSSMVLQLFVGPWPLLQFRYLLYTVGTTPWTSDQPVTRPLPTHSTTQPQNKRTQTSMPIHALSGIRTHNPSVRASEGSSCVETTVIGWSREYLSVILRRPYDMTLVGNNSDIDMERGIVASRMTMAGH